MMDGDSLYPTSFHPCHQHLNPICTANAKHLDRRDLPSIKYYIIDFGNSSAFDDQGRLIDHFEVFRQSPKIPVDDAESIGSIGDDQPNVLTLEAIKARILKIEPSISPEELDTVQLKPRIKKEEPQPKPFMVTGRDGLDREVPELSYSVPYNPFAVDIFTLGNVYKKDFLQVR